MARHYFGTDGIRGKANTSPMTAEIAMKVGMAAGVAFKRGNHRHRVVIGKDTRLSGYMIENALVAGFTAAGMDVFQLGPVPTPAVAMLTRSMRADIGVMISASHNPYEDNGIKLFGPDGYKLSDEIELHIEELIDRDLSRELASAPMIGRATRVDGVRDRYIEFAKRTLPRELSLEGLRVVVDCANGAAYKVAPEALWELGADVIAIGDEPNGFNINLECGSTNTGSAAPQGARDARRHRHCARRRRRPRHHRRRAGARHRRRPDHGASSRSRGKSMGKLTGGGIVATVMSNLGLERYLGGIGLNLARTKVGDRYVVEHMRAHGYNVGGEQSGHVVLSDFSTTGDGLIAALQVLSRGSRNRTSR